MIFGPPFSLFYLINEEKNIIQVSSKIKIKIPFFSFRVADCIHMPYVLSIYTKISLNVVPLYKFKFYSGIPNSCGTVSLDIKFKNILLRSYITPSQTYVSYFSFQSIQNSKLSLTCMFIFKTLKSNDILISYTYQQFKLNYPILNGQP